jgi:F-type H+-transporting ATPase subunit delta
MSHPAECYAQALLELQYPTKTVEAAQAVWESCPALSEALTNPTISIPEKEAVIRNVFSKEMQPFFCTLCRNAETAYAPEIFQAFYEKKRQAEGCAHAVVEYVTPLTAEQQEGMRRFAQKVSGKQQVVLTLQENPDLMGGFVLRIGDFVYDRSVRYRIKSLRKKLAGQ